MGLYSKGIIRIGEEMSVTRYREIADKIAETGSTPYGVVAFKKNEPLPDIFPAPSAEAANNKYDALAEHPGEYVYVYLYRDNKAVDEAFFVATAEKEVRFEKKIETRKERVGTGWILGGVGVALFGLAVAFRQRRG